MTSSHSQTACQVLTVDSTPWSLIRQGPRGCSSGAPRGLVQGWGPFDECYMQLTVPCPPPECCPSRLPSWAHTIRQADKRSLQNGGAIPRISVEENDQCWFPLSDTSRWSDIFYWKEFQRKYETRAISPDICTNFWTFWRQKSGCSDVFWLISRFNIGQTS